MTAKPPALAIPEGCSAEMASQLHQMHMVRQSQLITDYYADKRVTRSPPPGFSSAAYERERRAKEAGALYERQAAKASQIMNRASALSEVVREPHAPGKMRELSAKPFSKMTRGEYAEAEAQLKQQYGVDLRQLSVKKLADLVSQPKVVQRDAPVWNIDVPIGVKPRKNGGVIAGKKKVEEGPPLGEQLLEEMNREPRWQMSRSGMGGFDVFVEHGPRLHVHQKPLAQAIHAYLTGNLEDMLLQRAEINAQLPKAP